MTARFAATDIRGRSCPLERAHQHSAKIDAVDEAIGCATELELVSSLSHAGNKPDQAELVVLDGRLIFSRAAERGG